MTAAGTTATGRELPSEVRAGIDRLRDRYPTTRALLLPALHLAQRAAGGWLPEATIAAVADELGLPRAEVYGVVSFYDLFHRKPVGRHRLRVCTNVSCMLRGSDQVVATLREVLGTDEGEVTPDGRASWTSFECLGACDSAPMMMVDESYRGDLTPEKVRRIVAELD